MKSIIVILAVGILISSIICLTYYAIQTLKGRVSKGETETPPKTKELEAQVHYPSFDDIKRIETDLINLTTSNCSSQNFSSFTVNGHPYYSVGPLSYIQETGQGISDFMTEMKNFDIVVNLMQQEETKVSFKGQTRSYDEVFSEYSQGWSKTQLHPEMAIHSSPEPVEQEVFRLLSWVDEKESLSDAMLLLADRISHYHSKDNQEPKRLIHCRRGLQRTATFIVIVEMMRKKDLQQMTFLDCKKFIYTTLRQLAPTANGRLPTREQLTMLFSNAFIEKVKKYPQR